MTGRDPAPDERRRRRRPAPFRRLVVHEVTPVHHRLVRVSVGGDELAGWRTDQPASSVRVLLPTAGTSTLTVPRWTGNEFVLPDGDRPVIRTFTPGPVDPVALRMDLHVVTHGDGEASRWAAGVRPGDPVAVSGPGRGYLVDHDAPGFLLAGDETAVPAITQLLAAIPEGRPVRVMVETVAGAEVALTPGAKGEVEWVVADGRSAPGRALVAAVADAPPAAGTRVWAAGEAAAMQALRRLLFEVRAVPRPHASVHGYWKQGRAADVASGSDRSGG